MVVIVPGAVQCSAVQSGRVVAAVELSRPSPNKSRLADGESPMRTLDSGGGRSEPWLGGVPSIVPARQQN